tara:strand:- start:3995 stop:4663 length:669 start_codon:yes stop_codon:yes gene_type:complete
MSMLNSIKSKAKKSLEKPFFLSPTIRLNKLKNLSLSELNDEGGFTLVELIVVVMMIGILSSIAIPQFMTAADKAKQKEATGIVAALVKAATAYQTEYGGLPANAEQLSEYAKFQKCTAAAAATQGGTVCKGQTPVALANTDTAFISSSGHYAVSFRLETVGGVQQFQVLANPNGTAYSANGSAVTGCYNPQEAISEIYEFTAKAASNADGKGIRTYRGCPNA